MCEILVADWGTSNLRLFVCNSEGSILKSIENESGIKSVSKGAYPNILFNMIDSLGVSRDTPLFVCGMAGARGGWIEAPYCDTPVALKDISLKMKVLPKPFDGYLLPGVRTVSPQNNTDVMRGEEIQIFGALSLLEKDDAVLCIPGTHSKWVRVKDGKITSFLTFMTGDIYQALSQTILNIDLDPSAKDNDLEVFVRGVNAVEKGDFGLLHNLFTVRTRVLDGVLQENEVSNFTSGMLIGAELEAAYSFINSATSVIIVGSNNLCKLYQRALMSQNIDCTLVKSNDASCRGVAELNKII